VKPRNTIGAGNAGQLAKEKGYNKKGKVKIQWGMTMRVRKYTCNTKDKAS